MQVRLLHMGGLGSKAALLLATLVGGNSAASLAALRALLQPQDLAALVHIALLASHAQDLVSILMCCIVAAMRQGFMSRRPSSLV